VPSAFFFNRPWEETKPVLFFWSRKEIKSRQKKMKNWSPTLLESTGRKTGSILPKRKTRELACKESMAVSDQTERRKKSGKGERRRRKEKNTFRVAKK